MGKGKLIFIAVIGGLLVYASFLYLRIWYFLNSYKYGYSFKGVNAQALKDLTALANGRAFIDVKFELWIDNPGNFSVTLNDLVIDLYYKGQYIGKTFDFPAIITQRNGRTTFQGTARIQINRALYYLLLNANTDIVRINYVAKFKAYGLPFNLSYKDYYDFKLSDYTS